MAVTTTYAWTNKITAAVNNVQTAGNQANPAITALDNGSYFTTWDDNTPAASVEGRLYSSGASPLQNEFTVNTTQPNSQTDSSIAAFAGGMTVVMFTDFSVDPNGDIRGRFFNADGTANGDDFNVSIGSSGHDIHSDVAVLSNGQMVTTFTRQFGGGDNDIDFEIMNVARTTAIIGGVDTAPQLNTDNSSVAGLAGGGFVVAYEQSPKAGGDTSVFFRLFDNAGNPRAISHQIDNIGTINNDIQVTALKDGGFAVAYTDDGWHINGTEITLQVFNGDGTTRTSAILVNSLDITGNQNHPALTTLSNGDIVVGWSDGAAFHEQVFDPAGNRLGTDFLSSGLVVEAELAGLAHGLVANVRSSGVTDAGGDNSIRSGIDEFSRTTVGDFGPNVLTGDSLRDHFTGDAGNDTFVIAPGGGTDDITDFVHNADRIDLSAFSNLHSFGDVMSLATTVNGNTVIDFGNGDTLTLDGVVKGTLGAADFVLSVGGVSPKHDIFDFNGDLKNDLFFGNDTSHGVATWLLNGTQVTASPQIGVVTAGWDFTASGDFNGDHKTDLLFTNATTHGVAMWQMDGTQVTASPQIGVIADGWSLTKTGDFNGDGKTDLLFLNSTTHGVAIWQMDGTTVTKNPQIGIITDGWHFADTGDFNGDHKTDLLMLNDTTHGAAIWQMDGTTVTSSSQIGTITNGWHFAATGDFNGDGKTDLLMLNNATQGAAIWQMDGNQVTANPQIGTVNTSGGWHFADLGDYNGDHQTDLLFINDSTGGVAIWQMNGTTVAANPQVGIMDAGSRYAGYGDYNGDGKTDLLFVNDTSHAATVWEMNGTHVDTAAQIGTINAPDWHLIA
jgi:hypothetical protein